MSNLTAAVLFAVTDHRFSNKCFQTNVPEQMFEQEIFSESSEGVKNEKHPHTKQKACFFLEQKHAFSTRIQGNFITEINFWKLKRV